MRKKVKNPSKYSKTLKIKIAQEYLSGRFSYAVAAEEYRLKNKDVVKEFVKWYKRHYLSSTNPIKLDPNSSKSDEQKQQDELSRLRAELESARLKIAALEKMIDLAETDLDISIRKKSGTKQSKK